MKRRRGRRFLRWVIPILLVVAASAFLGVFLIVYQITHPKTAAESLTPKHFLIPYQDVTWSSEGREIRGWFMAGIRGAPCIIVYHGYGQSMSAVLQLAMLFKESGYNVLMFNLRGHGQSGFQRSTLGLSEANDLLSAVDYVMTYLPVDRTRLGMWGVTTGAFAALRAAESSEKISVLALDSPYPNVDAFLQLRATELTGIDNAVCRSLYRLAFMAYFWVGSGELDRTTDYSKIFHIQTLFISEMRNPALADMTRSMFHAAEGRKELSTFTKTRNSVLLGGEIQIYDTQILKWFKQALPL